MDADKRRSKRRAVVLEVELVYPSGEKQIVHTRDMSDGGLFIVMEKLIQPTIGECVKVTLCDDTINEQLPSNDAVVVRQAPDGIGLAFIEMELDE